MPKLTLVTPPKLVTTEQFLKGIFGEQYQTAHVTSFPDDPGAITQGRRGICWAGGFYKDYRLEPGNQFVAVSRFKATEDGKSRRRKANFIEQSALMIDDMLEKTVAHQVEKLPEASAKVRTSNHSQQWWYKFDKPCTDQNKLDNLVDGLIAAGLTSDGKDPGMKSTSRYGRLPGAGSINTKAKRIAENGGVAPEVILLEWHPERTYTMEELAAPFGIDLHAPRKGTRTDGAVDVPDHPILKNLVIKSVLSDGKYDITCPWIDEHTDRDDSGTAVFTNADGSFGFSCHHGHCQDRTGKDLMDIIEAKSPGFQKHLKDWQFSRQMEDVAEGGMNPLASLPTFALAGLKDVKHNVIDLSHNAISSDLGKAYFHENARYVSVRNKWFLWDGYRWDKDEQLGHLSIIGQYLKNVADSLIGQAYSETEPEKKRRLFAEAKSLKSAPFRHNIRTMIESDPVCSVLQNVFDTDIGLLGTPAGTVLLKAGELREAMRVDQITKSTSVAPVDSEPTQWLSFLNRIFAGDAGLIAFIQRLCGYALTGLTVEERVFFCYGTGANGKSKFLDTLFYVMGDYARRAPSSLFLENRNDQHPTSMAGLQGARLVLGSELPAGKTWNEETLKDMTGGDTITARRMRQDFFDFTPQFTLIIAGNHQPQLKNVDESMRRRVTLIPFDVTIPEEERDKDLGEKLKAEAGEILSWCIKGAVAYHENGLSIPDCVANASAEYIENEDVLGEFITKCLQESPGEREEFGQVYQAYRLHMQFFGSTYVKREKEVRKEMKERGMLISRSNNVYWLKDYSLQSTQMPASPRAETTESFL